jgi:exonuclease III
MPGKGMSHEDGFNDGAHEEQHVTLSGKFLPVTCRYDYRLESFFWWRQIANTLARCGWRMDVAGCISNVKKAIGRASLDVCVFIVMVTDVVVALPFG